MHQFIEELAEERRLNGLEDDVPKSVKSEKVEKLVLQPLQQTQSLGLKRTFSESESNSKVTL